MGKIEKQDDAVLLAHALAYHLQKQGNRLAADIIRAAIPAIPGLTAEALESRMDSAPQPPSGRDSEPMTGDLLPCPFCGKSDHDRWPCDWLDNSGAQVVRCVWCHGAAPMNVWNRRTAPPSAPVGVEGRAREAVALALDERGHHTEANNVRKGIDLDEYRDALSIARAALAKQPAADTLNAGRLKALHRGLELARKWATGTGVHGHTDTVVRSMAEELRVALSSQEGDYEQPAAVFDAWQKNPYTKVLMKSIAEDYVPKHDQRPAAVDGAMVERGAKALRKHHLSAGRALPIAECREDARVTLTAALAAQPGGDR